MLLLEIVLPNEAVQVESANHLDKFQAIQDFKFDWNADVTRIGSHGLNSIMNVY